HPLSSAILLRTLVLAALIAFASSAAASAVPGVRAQSPSSIRYLDPIFTRTERTNDIVYGTAIDKPTGRPVDLKLDIYEPTGDTAAARPVFIFLFGGGFVAGTKDLEPTVYCEQMARRGYVAIAPSYRLNQGDVWFDGIPAAVADARQAVRWVRAHAADHRLDATRIIIGGSSAGAITSLFVAYTDMARTAGSEAGGGASSDGSEVALVMDLWGGLYSEVNQLDAGEPPLAIVHGTADDVVPYTEATNLRDRAEAQGVPYVFLPLEGKGHAPYMPIELMTTLAPFFYERLWPKAVDAPPSMPDLSPSDRLYVEHEFMTLGRTENGSIEAHRAPGGWYGTATFKVDAWEWTPRRILEASHAITITNEAMATFFNLLADTPLAESLAQPTPSPIPDNDWTFSFGLSAGADAIVDFTSRVTTFNRRQHTPYAVTIGDRALLTDGDEPDRALAAIYDALGFEDLDRLIEEASRPPTAMPMPTAPPRTRIWLPAAQR
ncbi:MAG: alpha/beta hydrolase, partial [Ardenticatenales bacterium]